MSIRTVFSIFFKSTTLTQVSVQRMLAASILMGRRLVQLAFQTIEDEPAPPSERQAGFFDVQLEHVAFTRREVGGVQG